MSFLNYTDFKDLDLYIQKSKLSRGFVVLDAKSLEIKKQDLTENKSGRVYLYTDGENLGSHLSQVDLFLDKSLPVKELAQKIEKFFSEDLKGAPSEHSYTEKKEEKIKLLEEEHKILEQKIESIKKDSIEARGLREYLARLIGVSTMEQLVYETEILRVLRFKGIKVSLLYVDDKGGFLCTKNTLRKVKNIEAFSSQKVSQKKLADILSRPVLSENYIISKKAEEEEAGESSSVFYAIFESQNKLGESKAFLDVLTALLYANFMRVLRSEQRVKSSTLLSLAFSQIQETSILVRPDFQIRFSNQKEAIGKTCYKHLFNLEQPCENCPLISKEFNSREESLSRKSFELKEQQHKVHSSRVLNKNQNFFLNIYESEKLSRKRDSIKIQRGKLQSLGLVTKALTHELNNPLTGIKELSKELSFDYEGQTQEDLLEISKASERCLQIIQSLNKFSSKKIEFTRLNLKSIIEEALVLTKMMLRESRVELKLEEDLWISGSQTLLSQAFFNILKNSVEAMDGKGGIEISLTKEGGLAKLKISDSGPGFSEEVKDINLFGTKNKEKGSGYGLFLVNEFVKLHGALLDFGNRKDSQGAFFEITFNLEN